MNSSSELSFSIVVPVYNCEAILDRFKFCVESLLTQSYRDFELIFVDDGSIDSTPVILSRYANRDSRVRIFTHPINRYIGSARNNGVKISRGRYVYFCDFDDYLYPQALEIIHRKLELYQQPEILQFTHKNIDEEHFNAERLESIKKSSHRFYVRRSDRRYTAAKVMSRFLRAYVPHAPWVRVIQADLARKVNFPDIWGEDLPYALELFSVAKTTVFIPDPLYVHLVRKDSEQFLASGSRAVKQSLILLRTLIDKARSRGIDTSHTSDWRYFYAVQQLKLFYRLDLSRQILDNFDRPDFFEIRFIIRYLLDGLKRGDWTRRWRCLRHSRKLKAN